MIGVQLCQEGQDLEICHQVRNGAWQILIGVIPGIENLRRGHYNITCVYSGATTIPKGSTTEKQVYVIKELYFDKDWLVTMR